MTQLEIWVQIAQAAINYIVVTTISSRSQQGTVTDVKTDLRTTKEDIMSELKDSRESLLNELKTETTAIVEIITAEIQNLKGGKQ